VQTAVSTYRGIPRGRTGGEECRLCAKCEAACPNGIAIAERLAAANRLFAQLA
jgi:predicted aldo/keto reductase-like oxidoreductase